MDAPVLDYARTLRVVGQVLESLNAEAYDVIRHGNHYLIRCQTKQSKARGLSSILRMWKRQNLSHTAPGQRPLMNTELLYTLEDIQRLDEQGKEKRCDLHGSPDPFCLSSILRATGDFLNRKGNCRLLLVSSHDHQVVVLFETPQGVRKLEDYQLPSFYEFWVGMYVKRKSTTGPEI
ncbi:MAG: hypothetical protein ACREQW_19080 [Candidatus Binatia bacterium]